MGLDDGKPENLFSISISGPLGFMIFGEWQSSQPLTVTKYSPRFTFCVLSNTPVFVSFLAEVLVQAITAVTIINVILLIIKNVLSVIDKVYASLTHALQAG
jgi:hypothetical protein